MKAQNDNDRLASDGAIWWTIDWQVKATIWGTIDWQVKVLYNENRMTSGSTIWSTIDWQMLAQNDER